MPVMSLRSRWLCLLPVEPYCPDKATNWVADRPTILPVAAIYPSPNTPSPLFLCICTHLFILHSVRVLYFYKLCRNWRFFLCRALGVFFFPLLCEWAVCWTWLVQLDTGFCLLILALVVVWRFQRSSFPLILFQ